MESTPHIKYNMPKYVCHEKVSALACEYTPPNGHILDIGCGTGYILEFIQAAGPSFRLYAADIDEHCLRITKDKVSLVQDYAIQEIEDLLDIDKRFDTIIMSHVIEHVYNPYQTVNNIFKLLKPDGCLILAVPNPVRFNVILNCFLRRHYAPQGHVCIWDKSHWDNFLNNILHVQVVVHATDHVPIPLISTLKFMRPIQIYLGKILPWLAASHISVVKPPR